MEFIIPENDINISLDNNIYRYKLNNRYDPTSYIDKGYNINGIFINFPDSLKCINIILGNQIVTTFDRDNISTIISFPIYLTLCSCVTVIIELVYDKDWLKSQKLYEWKEEITEEIVEDIIYNNDEYVEIFDGENYYSGKRVIRDYNLIRKSINNINIKTPTIILKLEKAYDNKDVIVPVLQKIDISKFDDEYKQRLIIQHNLQILSDNIGIITNKIQYSHNIARLIYSF